MSYYPKIKILNKHLMMLWWNNGTPEVVANVFETAKAYCIAKARRPSWELPYITGFLDWRLEDNYPQLFRWYAALTDDNPPAKVRFDKRLEEMIADIDFSKPFDPEKAESIRSQFRSDNRKVEVDAEAIAMGEMEE